MDKVDSIQKFVKRAREIHGDTYDYSQSVWSGSQKPIKIICRKCGPVTLAEAGSHYGKRRCGCSKCNHESAMQKKRTVRQVQKTIRPKVICNGCGKWSFADICMKCRGRRIKEIAKERKDRLDRLRKRKCPKCSEEINSIDARKVFCSKRCSDASKKHEMICVKCTVCGITLERCKRKIESRKQFCCSLECQRQLALVENRGRIKKLPTNVKLPTLWRCDCGELNQHKNCSNKNCFLRKIRRELRKALDRRKAVEFQESWDYAIASRLSSGRGRVKSKTKRGIQGFNASGAVNSIAARRKYAELCFWEKKIGNKLSNMAKRRKRKHESKKSNRFTSQTETYRQRVQMCFNWMAP